MGWEAIWTNSKNVLTITGKVSLVNLNDISQLRTLASFDWPKSALKNKQTKKQEKQEKLGPWNWALQISEFPVVGEAPMWNPYLNYYGKHFNRTSYWNTKYLNA